MIEWEDATLPDPGPGEALVRHEAVGLNFIDTYHRTGLYPLPLPSGLGGEGAGVVEAVGEGVTDVAAGRPGGLCHGRPRRLRDGAADRRAAPRAHARRRCRSRTAAAVMLKGLTVQYLFRRTVHDRPRDDRADAARRRAAWG